MWRRKRSDTDFQEEIRAHIDLETDRLINDGVNSEEARALAVRRFGNVGKARETFYESRRALWFEHFIQDMRYAVRTLFRTPAFAIVAIVTLALGIGASTAIFQVLDTVVLKPLPVRDPQRLVELQGYHNANPNGFSYPLLREMAARQTTVEGIFASASASIREFSIAGRAPAEPVAAWLATGNYFRLIGTEAQIGRFFTEADDDTSMPAVAVISDGFWRREFGRQADAVGQSVRINGIAATIVGVTKREFSGDRVGTPVDIWLPISFAGQLSHPSSLTASSIWLQPMARLRSDVPSEQAQAELSLLWDQLKEFSIRFRGVTQYRLELLPAYQGLGTLSSQFSRSLWLLMGIVTLLTLLASCNLANLLLARASARAREIGMRLAIGARRGRLIRQLLTESLVLSLFGGGLGLMLAAVTSNPLVKLVSLGENWRLSLHVDWRILGFTTSLSLAVAVIFGLIPALVATRVSLNTALQAHSHSHTGARSRSRAAKLFVVSQVALSFVLMTGALLLVRSFWNLTHQDFGLKPEGVLFAELDGDGTSFKELIDTEVRQTIYRRINEIPGVVSGAVIGVGILGRWSSVGESPVALPERVVPGVKIVPVSPRYLETMEIPILRGRSITEDDRRNGTRVAVVNQSAARLIFGSDDPIGRTFASGTVFPSNFMFVVVGVMKDHRFGSPREPFGPLVYVPVVQMPAGGPPRLVLRTSTDPMQFVQPLQQSIREVAPSLKISHVSLVRDLVRNAARQERLLAWLSGAFGALAVLLASIGLYGVVAYSTQRRTQEIGIRLTLGARIGQIRRSVLQDTLSTVIIGVVAGLAATVVMSRYVQSILFELTANDPLTIATTSGVMLVVGIFAGYLPARRASRVDLVVALRYE
jgi:predicted permease